MIITHTGITSLTVHHPTHTCFSGGTDGTVRYWKMNSSSGPLDSNERKLDTKTKHSKHTGNILINLLFKYYLSNIRA